MQDTCLKDSMVRAIKTAHEVYSACRKNGTGGTALAGIEACGLRPELCLAAFEDFRMPFGREEHFKVCGREMVMTMAKNTVSEQNVFHYLASLPGKYSVVIGINAAAEDGTDVSWAEKFPYGKYRELLAEAAVTGDAAGTVAKALENAGIKAAIISSPVEIVRYTENCRSPVFMILNYTCMMTVLDAFCRAGYLQPFWE